MTRYDEIIAEVIARPMPCGKWARAADLRGAWRAQELSEARHAIWFLARRHLGHLSYPLLARKFNRDHSTAMHGTKRVLRQWPKFEPLITAAERALLKLWAAREPFPLTWNWMST